MTDDEVMMDRSRSPFANLRVLDFAGAPAIYGSKLLADLGADVVRVEPVAGDPLRSAGPFFGDRPGPGRSLSFAFYNTSKRSVALDATSPAGEYLLRRLIDQADLVIENGPPGACLTPSLSFDRLRQTNQGLVWASVTPFGQAGPRAGWAANDLVAMAAGGVLYLNGIPGRPPLHAPLSQAYHLGGISAVSGALLALAHREQSGVGRLVDVSLQAAVATATENTLGFWDVNRQIRKRQGTIAFNGTTIVYQCLDGWVAGMAGNRWEELTRWAEAAGVADDEWYDPRLVERDSRAAMMPVANRLVAKLFLTQTMEHVAAKAREIRIPIQPVNRISDLFADPQLSYRGFWVPVAHDELGATITYPGAPFLSSSGFWSIRQRAPLPGEHSRSVLVEAGFATSEIEALIEARVVGQWMSGVRRVHEESSRPAAPSMVPATSQPTRKALPDTASPAAASGPIQGEKAPKPPTTLPLAGVRVLDFSQAITGPLAGRILAEYGAEVIKIEWGRRPDPQRSFPPRPTGNTGPNVSALFNLVNASKRSLTLNLNEPGGRDLLHRLVSIADVILDNYGNDPFPKWGLAFDEARVLSPDIIMARSSTTGRNGPREGLPGLGYGIAAAAGWNHLMGIPGDPPVGMGPAYPDYSVNLHHLVIAILTALEHRRLTGEGQYIDLSQHESTITWLGPAILDYTANGRVAGPTGNRRPDFAPHGVFPTRGDDAWIAIAVEEACWPTFAGLLEEDGLQTETHEFASHLARKANEDSLEQLVAGWTASQDGEYLARRLQDAGIAAYRVLTGSDLVADPQLSARGHYLALDHPEAGRRLWDSFAFRLDQLDVQPRRTRLLGEDNDWVLGDLLGFSEDASAAAYVDGVID